MSHKLIFLANTEVVTESEIIQCHVLCLCYALITTVYKFPDPQLGGAPSVQDIVLASAQPCQLVIKIWGDQDNEGSKHFQTSLKQWQ